MLYNLHKNFEKQFKKLKTTQKRKVISRLKLFVISQDHPILSNHKLRGKYLHHRSINTGGDLRAIYKEVKSGLVEFIVTGTHSQLYN